MQSNKKAKLGKRDNSETKNALYNTNNNDGLRSYSEVKTFVSRNLSILNKIASDTSDFSLALSSGARKTCNRKGKNDGSTKE